MKYGNETEYLNKIFVHATDILTFNFFRIYVFI